MVAIQNISKHGSEEIKLIAETASKYREIETIYLFGSCAKGNDTEKSDIDTLIIWKNYEDVEEQGLRIAGFIEDVFNKKMFNWDRLFLNSVKELKDMNYGVWNEIQTLNNIIYKRSN